MPRKHLIKVRLTDIPFEERMRAARRACRDEGDQEERAKILAVAVCPSDRDYWVVKVA